MRWAARQIVAKDGTEFGWWRVTDSNGRTVAVLRDRVRAISLARDLEKIQLDAEFLKIVVGPVGLAVAGDRS